MNFLPWKPGQHAAALGFGCILGLLCQLCPASTASAARRDAVREPIYDIVAVGLGRGRILLATPVRSGSGLVWRVRRIAISAHGDTAHSVALSATGTKALVVFADGTPRVVDLTMRTTEIAPDSLLPSQHRLHRQRFPFAAGGKVCLVDDLGNYDSRNCREAISAAVRDDGRALYALNDGRLVVALPNGDWEGLPYRLPAGSEWQLLAGHAGDLRDFLVLVTDSGENISGGQAAATTAIIDPRYPAAPIARYADRLEAALRAQFAFQSSSSGRKSVQEPFSSSDATLSNLVKHLEQDFGPAELAWSFYRVRPDERLYAPVLEPAPGEPDVPSDVEIWQRILQHARGATRQAYAEAYAALGEQRWAHCTAYTRTLSYPGTWLIEYWYYYPFDEGKPHAHVHDSEHMFIEVDKLGGAVRGVFASDHDALAPNNLYSVLVKDASPVALPLYATVEFGKHAMAPDLDHDGRFTRGVDDNLHREPYAVWGLRDSGKRFGDLMEPYRAGMSLPRSEEDRLALSDAAELFPDFEKGAGHQVCHLEPLPEDPPCKDCAVATPEAAMTHLVDHPDALAPENIYKPYVLPWREVRFGVGIHDWSGGRAQLSVALVGDFRHMTGGLLPAPARLGLEYSWSPLDQGVPVRFGGREQYVNSRSTMFAGLRFERFVTHTQGFYFGATPEWVDISLRAIDGVVSPAGLHWQYNGVSYHAGYVLELPSARWGNLTNHLGVVIRSAPTQPVLFEWRVSMGLFRRRGRHNFGARPGDRNPYN